MFERLLEYLGLGDSLKHKVIEVYSETYNEKYLVKVRDYDLYND